MSEGHEAGVRRTRRRFSDEFKRDAVEMVRSSGKTVAEVASELGISDTSLGNWVRQRQVDEGEREGLSTDERQRLRELERQNAELRQERDLLKRTVAFAGVVSRRSDALALRGYPEGGRVPGDVGL